MTTAKQLKLGFMLHGVGPDWGNVQTFNRFMYV